MELVTIPDPAYHQTRVDMQDISHNSLGQLRRFAFGALPLDEDGN